MPRAPGDRTTSGVIGIAVFRERAAAATALRAIRRRRLASKSAPPATWPAQATAPASSADRAMAQAEATPQRLGTGHGEREWAPVGQTEFVRASRSPQQVSQLRYDDADHLVAIGVLPHAYPPYVRKGPRAFPNGFVADPPRW